MQMLERANRMRSCTPSSPYPLPLPSHSIVRVMDDRSFTARKPARMLGMLLPLCSQEVILQGTESLLVPVQTPQAAQWHAFFLLVCPFLGSTLLCLVVQPITGFQLITLHSKTCINTIKVPFRINRRRINSMLHISGRTPINRLRHHSGATCPHRLRVPAPPLSNLVHLRLFIRLDTVILLLCPSEARLTALLKYQLLIHEMGRLSVPCPK
jgi:hypothetical protein